MKARTLLGWFTLNGLSILLGFLVAILATALVPSEMVSVWSSWIRLVQTITGAKTVAEYLSPLQAFATILILNSLSVFAVSLAGTFLLSPIILPIYGAFYAAVISGGIQGFPGPRGLVLLCLENLFLNLSATFACTLGSETFGLKGINPRSILRFWLESFLRTPKPTMGFHQAVRARGKEVAFSFLIVASLLILSAWFEVWVPS